MTKWHNLSSIELREMMRAPRHPEIFLMSRAEFDWIRLNFQIDEELLAETKITPSQKPHDWEDLLEFEG